MYKNINYLENNEFENKNEYTEEEKSNEEIEVMLHTRTQDYTSESKKEQRLRKRFCHDDDMITDEEAPSIIVPTSFITKPKERKFKRKMISKNITEFNIAKYISNL